MAKSQNSLMFFRNSPVGSQYRRNSRVVDGLWILLVDGVKAKFLLCDFLGGSGGEAMKFLDKFNFSDFCFGMLMCSSSY